jgi:hypothetical protein
MSWISIFMLSFQREKWNVYLPITDYFFCGGFVEFCYFAERFAIWHEADYE